MQMRNNTVNSIIQTVTSGLFVLIAVSLSGCASESLFERENISSIKKEDAPLFYGDYVDLPYGKFKLRKIRDEHSCLKEFNLFSIVNKLDSIDLILQEQNSMNRQCKYFQLLSILDELEYLDSKILIKIIVGYKNDIGVSEREFDWILPNLFYLIIAAEKNRKLAEDFDYSIFAPVVKHLASASVNVEKVYTSIGLMKNHEHTSTMLLLGRMGLKARDALPILLQHYSNSNAVDLLRLLIVLNKEQRKYSGQKVPDQVKRAISNYSDKSKPIIIKYPCRYVLSPIGSYATHYNFIEAVEVAFDYLEYPFDPIKRDFYDTPKVEVDVSVNDNSALVRPYTRSGRGFLYSLESNSDQHLKVIKFRVKTFTKKGQPIEFEFNYEFLAIEKMNIEGELRQCNK